MPATTVAAGRPDGDLAGEVGAGEREDARRFDAEGLDDLGHAQAGVGLDALGGADDGRVVGEGGGERG